MPGSCLAVNTGPEADAGPSDSQRGARDGGPGLRRDVGLTLFALYGAGNIIGAGIYVLVGKVAGEAGLLTPLAFLIAAAVAGLTGLSYGELGARYPVSAGEAVYLQRAFNRRWLSMATGFLIALAGLVSAATMARGFVGYLNEFLAVPAALVIVIFVSLLTLIAIRGIAESAFVAALLTLVEAGGLLWIISVAAPNFGGLVDFYSGEFSLAEFSRAELSSADFTSAGALPQAGAVWQGVFAAAFLAFFAFIGFEDMVSIAEEVREPERNMPRGILLAFAISTVLYLLVSVAAIATLPIDTLAASDAPLADVYRAATGRSVAFISLIGLIAVINGALIQIIKAARVFYGMSSNGWLPAFFGVVNPRTRTPLRSTLVAGGIVLVFALALPLVSLAKTTSAMVLLVFILVNLALITIKRSGPPPEGVRAMPMWVPVLGALASALILLAAF
jgi:APA family basic amino acid/polyamine antiporter